MYDPTIGKFISEDWILDDRLNNYRYVRNSPTNFTDPSGLQLIVDDGSIPRRLPPPTSDSLAIPFISDDKTSAAGWWNWATCDECIEIEQNRIDWNAAMEKLDRIPDGSIKSVIISGHGNEGYIGEFDISSVTDVNSNEYKFLSKLKTKLAKNAHVDLRACFTAGGNEGVKFLTALSKFLNADVTGITDMYAVVPYGTERRASPDGNIKVTKVRPNHDQGKKEKQKKTNPRSKKIRINE